jgi:hypothetical protein
VVWDFIISCAAFFNFSSIKRKLQLTKRSVADATAISLYISAEGATSPEPAGSIETPSFDVYAASGSCEKGSSMSQPRNRDNERSKIISRLII